MQIWALDENPYQIAAQLHDKHILSSCLESAVMMCGAAYLLKQKDPENYAYALNEIPYKPFHLYHPLTQWMFSSFDNWFWHFKYFAQLLYEYNYRFQKIHNCNCVKTWVVNNFAFPTKRAELTFYPNFPYEYKTNNTVGDIIESYRRYYKIEKCYNKKWTNRPMPEWMK